MNRFAVIALVVLLAVAIGCRKKPQSTESDLPSGETGGAPKSESAKPDPAAAALRARGAVLTDAYGKTDGPVINATLAGPKFGDADVALLRSFTSVGYINLSGSKVTDAGLASLAALPHVHGLTLTDTAVTDEGLAHVRKLRNLRTLYLDGTAVTDAGMEALKGLSALDHVDARRTRVTEAGAETLKAARGRAVVRLDTKFTEFSPPDGSFSVAFPWKKPGQRTRTQQTPFGKVTDTAYEVEDGPKSAMVAVADFVAPLDRVNLEEVIASGRDSVARSFNATVAKDERRAWGTATVRDVVLDIRGRNGQGPAYFRYVIHGRRLYTLAILSDGFAIPEAEKDRFFSSFAILK